MKKYKNIHITSATLLAAAAVAGTAVLPLSASAAGYLQLSPYAGSPGSPLTVQGYQFGSGTPATVSLDGTSTSADVNDGSFAANLTVPALPSGSYPVNVTTPTDQASASYYVNNQPYYPKAGPSAWYVLPTQQLTLSGTGFAPDTQVVIDGGDSAMTATTDGSGGFSTQPITIPFSWQNSKRTFTISSPGTAYQIQLTVQIGTFYPGLDPSTYWTGTDTGMSASATGFAPGETIVLQVNGTEATRATADGSGNASFSFTTPNSGSSFTLTAQGLSSLVSASRTIGLHS